MKVLVTGSSGFIGQHMLTSLQSKDIHCVPFSRKNGYTYSDISIDRINNEEIDVIVHLAGLAHDTNNVNNEELYYEVNTELTKGLFDKFTASNASVFIYLSSIKALADMSDNLLTENLTPDPKSVYGKSKLAAENYLLNQSLTNSKRIIILRPAMVYGPGNKGNLNLLYQIVAKGMPWPLGAYENLRSFCSVENLCFVVNEIIQNPSILSGVYHIADDEPISTNDLIPIIAKVLKRKPRIWKVPKYLVNFIALLGDSIKLPINTERLHKLTSSFRVSNGKISAAIGKPMPVSVRDGLFKTLSSFK